MWQQPKGRVNSAVGSDITQVPVVTLIPQAMLMYLPPYANRNHICVRSQLQVLRRSVSSGSLSDK